MDNLVNEAALLAARRDHERVQRADFTDALEKIILDPKYHDILTLVKGVRNGIVYGSKVRFPHALV